MVALITNARTKEQKVISLLECPESHNPIILEQVADQFIKRIASTYPKAYKIVHNRKNHISIIDGNVTKCIFDINMVEELNDCDDSFLY
jgi:hypothetical protein